MHPLVPAPSPKSPPVEFFRLPRPGERDPHFGLARSWYYQAAAQGEIKLVSLRHRGAIRGVRLVSYDSVLEHIQRASAPHQPESIPCGR
jgi:hypothetical protein